MLPKIINDEYNDLSKFGDEGQIQFFYIDLFCTIYLD